MCKGPKTVSRWFYRCKDCLEVTAANVELIDRWAYTRTPAAKCGACGGDIEAMGRVTQTHARLVGDSVRCACDSRCTSAPGPNCECSCGGENHGTGALVDVETDRGPIPVLTPRNVERSARIAAEYRAALAPFIATRDRHWATKREGRWLSETDYRELAEAVYTINRAAKARTHAGRMKMLTARAAA